MALILMHKVAKSVVAVDHQLAHHKQQTGWVLQTQPPLVLHQQLRKQKRQQQQKLVRQQLRKPKRQQRQKLVRQPPLVMH